jgi:WD40 repeat protein
MESGGWRFQPLSCNTYPRQFEFHPSREDLIFGTLSGFVYNVDIDSGSIRNLGRYGSVNMLSQIDSILGLCWFRNSDSRFIAGSSNGTLSCGDTRDGINGRVPGRAHSIVKEYPSFNKLTSVHINSGNDFILTSGYSYDARVYDLETGTVLVEYKNAHNNHINISRFANHSPFLFTTSSFDGTAKSFDLRMRQQDPLFSMKCASGIVMISYSPDDTFILASALDNEISQFLTVDGRKHATFDVPRTGLDSNFTRAYYSSTGAYVVTGACEESHVSVLCASTGRLLARQDMYPNRRHSSLYVQVRL